MIAAGTHISLLAVLAFCTAFAEIRSLTSEAAATTYDGPYIGRCLGELTFYPVGGAGQAWDSTLRQQAESWCDSRSDCHGFMHYDVTVSNEVKPDYCCHTSACSDWCGRPQFCMDATTADQITPNGGWVSYLKPRL
eukprot:TRINITY_DN7217_c0_g1_i9.p3 TRINITY_DN7217_c0_g1~~TRINITY_DN7217_c0_g1_i9.p3  ORF type:complete len:136 (+),score=15.83 TRINITY_DN7217_c0_g1_i9:85-492(+)